MQGWRQPQPSRTNRPSSSGTAPRGPRDMRSRAVRARGCPRVRPFLYAMRPPGHVRETPDTVTVGAAHRSAARAWGARPVPFRTRKLSPIAPRVLRGQPVGGQGAADRWTAPSRTLELRRGRPRGLPLFCVNTSQCSCISPVTRLGLWVMSFYLKTINRITRATAMITMIKSRNWSRCCLRRLLDDTKIVFPCFGVSR